MVRGSPPPLSLRRVHGRGYTQALLLRVPWCLFVVHSLVSDQGIGSVFIRVHPWLLHREAIPVRITIRRLSNNKTGKFGDAGGLSSSASSAKSAVKPRNSEAPSAVVFAA